MLIELPGDAKQVSAWIVVASGFSVLLFSFPRFVFLQLVPAVDETGVFREKLGRLEIRLLRPYLSRCFFLLRFSVCVFCVIVVACSLMLLVLWRCC